MDINLASTHTISSDESYGVNAEYQQGVSEYMVEDSVEETTVKRKISLRPIITRILYVVAFLVPLFFLPWTSEFLEFNKQSLIILAAGLGLILFLIEAIQNGVLRIKASRLYLPLATVIIAGLVSSLLSKNIYQSLLGSAGGVQVFSFATIVALVIIFFLGLNVIEDGGKRLKQVVAGSVGLALLLSVIQIFGLFLIKQAPYNSYTFNTVGSFNVLALLGALLLPLFWETKIKVFKVIDLAKVAGVLALFLMVLANWWVVWVAGFVALISWMGFKILEAGRPNTKTYIFPMLIVIGGVLLMLVNFSVPILKSRLAVEVSPSFSSSIVMSSSVLKERPISGYGLGEFSIAYDKLKPSVIAQTIFAQTHFNQAASSALTLVVEGGLLMVLASVFLLAIVLLEIKKSKRGAGYLILGFVVLFFFFTYNATLLFLLFMALVLLELESPTVQEKEWVFEHSPKYSLFGSLAFIVGLVLVLAAGYFVTLRYVADAYYVQAIRGTDADTVIADFTKSINVNPQDARYYRLMSQAIIIKLGTELKDKGDKTPAAERLQKLQNLAVSAVDIAKRATDIDPNNVDNWINRGQVYQNLVGLVTGADSAAVSMFSEALKYSPSDPALYNSIGSTYLTVAENLRVLAANPPQNQPNLNLDAIKKQASDNFSKAEESYKKAIALNNNYGQALFALGVVYEREGRLPDSIKQFEKLAAGNPNDPSIAFELGLLYYRNSQKDQAFNQLQKATVLFPNYSNARWYLSLIYEERGDLPNALAQVLEIQKTNAQNELVKQRIAQLQAGKRIIPPQKVLNQKPL